ncbi:hypothetical protein BT69DRAFT_1325341, partial [Atractiella rhizophila]
MPSPSRVEQGFWGFEPGHRKTKRNEMNEMKNDLLETMQNHEIDALVTECLKTVYRWCLWLERDWKSVPRKSGRRSWGKRTSVVGIGEVAEWRPSCRTFLWLAAEAAAAFEVLDLVLFYRRDLLMIEAEPVVVWLEVGESRLSFHRRVGERVEFGVVQEDVSAWEEAERLRCSSQQKADRSSRIRSGEVAVGLGIGSKKGREQVELAL